MLTNIEDNLKYVEEYTKQKIIEEAKRIKKIDKKLNVTIVENKYVLPEIILKENKTNVIGGICNKDGQIIEASKIFPDKLITPYEFDPQKAIIDNREVIYIGDFYIHWGHFILEGISRLYYLIQNPNNNLPIIYTSKEPFQGNYLEFFKILGINTNRLIWVNNVTRFKKIIIPEVSMEVCKYYTKEYQLIFNTVKSNIKLSSPYKKVFFSTRNFYKSKGKDLGYITDIENIFEKNGFKIISPETMSLEEQIAILQNCEEFVSISGTLPHNLIFANPNIKATILEKYYHVNRHQILINNASSINVTYVDANLSFFPLYIGIGPFFFYITKYLKKYFDDNKIKYNKEQIPKNLNKKLYEYLNKYTHSTKTYPVKVPCFSIKKQYIFKNSCKEIPHNYLFKIIVYFINIVYYMQTIVKFTTTIIKYRLY